MPLTDIALERQTNAQAKDFRTLLQNPNYFRSTGYEGYGFG
jgi:hypothetical protein